VKAYAVFEGGGACGYAHIGALRAAEARGIEFCAVAGTSIGAAIAALVAAGYTSSDLFTEDNEGLAHGVLADDLETKLLDAREYHQIKRFSECRSRMPSGVISWLLSTTVLSPLILLLHGRL
jgi:NTE family protein